MKLTRTGLILLLSLNLSLISSLAVQAQTFSLTDELLSGTDGIFTTGTKVSPNDPIFTPFTSKVVFSPTIIFYSNSFGSLPAITDTFGSGWTELVPDAGLTGLDSAVRFTAPSSGLYDVSLTFVDASGSATSDVHLVLNGKSLFDNYINLEGEDSIATYANSSPLDLKAGDTLDFVVGNGDAFGGEMSGDDTTGLEATISEVPEPSTYALLGCGVLLLALMGRLHRAAN
jgi:hypothetical protein